MRRKNKKAKIEKQRKVFAATSSLSGGLSFLGSWQICHNLCLGIIALLGFFGIAVAGMPLLFLTQYSIYFWSAALAFLIPTLYMYFRKNCLMSKNLLLFNIGIIIFSFPFFQEISFVFWLSGASIVLFVIIKKMIKNKKLNSRH